MKKNISQIAFIGMLFILQSCSYGKDSKHLIYVSIPPQKYIIEQIVGKHIQVKCLLESGIDPETYDPSPKQMMEINKASVFFTLGQFYFEKILTEHIQENKTQVKVFSFSENINTINEDPHVWCSPKQMKICAELAYNKLSQTYPELEASFQVNYVNLSKKIDALDKLAEQQLRNNKRSQFIIFHPTLTYLAHDYNLQQYALEEEGKEASLKNTHELILFAKEEGIKTIFTQKEFPKATIQNIAKEFNGNTIEINPLNEDWASEMELTIKSLHNALNE